MSISFQGYPKSRPVVNGLASSSSQTQRSSFLSPQKGRFRVFFWAKSIFPAKRLTFAYSMPYIFWKLYIKGFKWNFLGQYWSILLGVRILLELVHLRFYNIWDCVISAQAALVPFPFSTSGSQGQAGSAISVSAVLQLGFASFSNPGILNVQWFIGEVFLSYPDSLYSS